MNENKSSSQNNNRLKKISAVLKNKKFKHSGAASVITILFIAIVVVLNIIVGALDDKLPLSWDLTSNKAFTITDQSKDFLAGLDKDIEIILLSDEADFAGKNEYFSQANSVLKQYSKLSSKITLTYIDPAKNPTYIQSNFPNEKLSTNSIIVRSNHKHKVISINDIFDISYGYYGAQGITASKAEQEVTSALIYVTSENQAKIAFLKGYGEQDYSAFSEILKKNNYDVKEVQLLTENIDEDVSIVVVFGPDRDYDSKGIEKIEKFLSGENKVLLFAVNPNKADIPVISTLLNKWNVKVGSGVIYETDAHRMTSNMSIFEAISDYVDPLYTKNLQNGDIPVLVPACRPIEVMADENVKTLLQYSKTSGIMPMGAGKDFDLKGHISGPIPSAVVSSKNLSDDTKQSHVIVVGSYVAFAPEYLAATSINNSAYFTNVLNVLSEHNDEGVIIESKSIGNEELGINASTANVVGMSFIVGVPVLVIIIGTFIMIKRRRK